MANRVEVSTYSELTSALANGQTWIVFTVSSLQIDAPLDLTNSQYPWFRFEGLSGRTTLYKKQNWPGGAIIQHTGNNVGNTLHLYLINLVFDSANEGYDPGCEFRNLDRCYFENCEWKNSNGDGCILGYSGNPIPDNGDPSQCVVPAYQVSTSRLYGCDYTNISGVGLKILNGIDISVFGGSASSCGAAIHWMGPGYCVSGINTSCYNVPALKNKITRGVGTILNFSASNSLDLYTVVLDYVYAIRIKGCSLDTQISYGSNAFYCFSEA